MELALAEGRLSRWEDLLDELTPRQLTVLQAYYKIAPWGERRADLREAVMATAISCALSLSPVSGQQASDRVEILAGYLGGDEKQTASPNAAAAMMRGAFPSRTK